MSTRKNEAKWIESRSRWQINVQADGVRRTFTSATPGRKGKIEAERKADKWFSEMLVDENTRCEILLDKWLEKLKLSTSRSNWLPVQGRINKWIKPVIGTKRINRLTQNDLQAVIDNAYSVGGLAAKTLKNIRGDLMAFIKFCRGANTTSFHPEELTIPASAKKSSKGIVGTDDIKKLFESSQTLYYGAVVDDFFINAYRFQVVTGVRPGELIGLQWNDIDGSRVSLERSINHLGEVTQGKNENAARTFVLGSTALSILEAQRQMLADYRLISPLVFPDRDGGHIDQRVYRVAWKRYCKHNGMTETTPYELRHTFVSINDEMPSGLKKMVVGHSQSMDTEGIYGHLKQGDMEKAAGYIDRAFGDILK